MWINHMLGGAYRQLIARLNNAFSCVPAGSFAKNTSDQYTDIHPMGAAPTPLHRNRCWFGNNALGPRPMSALCQ
jgi:hypothetical protein